MWCFGYAILLLASENNPDSQLLSRKVGPIGLRIGLARCSK